MCQYLIIFASFFIGIYGYPEWPSPSYWNGSYVFYNKNNTGTFTMCYDAGNNLFAKHYAQTGTPNVISLVFLDTKFYKYFVPQNTCTLTQLSAFPFPINQFENYSMVGKEIVNQKSVEHYTGTFEGVGEGPYSTDQYFSIQTGLPTGNIMINEPNWTTERRFFDYFWLNQTMNGCFNIINACN